MMIWRSRKLGERGADLVWVQIVSSSLFLFHSGRETWLGGKTDQPSSAEQKKVPCEAQNKAKRDQIHRESDETPESPPRFTPQASRLWFSWELQPDMGHLIGSSIRDRKWSLYFYFLNLFTVTGDLLMTPVTSSCGLISLLRLITVTSASEL